MSHLYTHPCNKLGEKKAKKKTNKKKKKKKKNKQKTIKPIQDRSIRILFATPPAVFFFFHIVIGNQMDLSNFQDNYLKVSDYIGYMDRAMRKCCCGQRRPW